MGFVPAAGREQRLQSTPAARSGPSGLSKLGIREIRPHWQLDTFTRQRRRRPRVALSGLAPAVQFPRRRVHRGRRQPQRRGRSAQPFTINSARGVHGDPGRYEFNEYFVLWRHERRGAVLVRQPLLDGRLLRRPPARLHVRAQRPRRTSTSTRRSTCRSTTSICRPARSSRSSSPSRVNYNFNTKMFLNALLQYNTDSRQWSSNLRFNVIHRPLSDFFLVYNERRDRAHGRPDRSRADREDDLPGGVLNTTA